MKVKIVRIDREPDYPFRWIRTHMNDSEFQELTGAPVKFSMLDWTDTSDIEDYNPEEMVEVRPDDDSGEPDAPSPVPPNVIAFA